MSEHLCPKCKGKGFIWYSDNDDRTFWYCNLCEFGIEEDESKETFCRKCSLSFPTVNYLFDKNESYYFCSFCGDKKLVKM
jgi:uncharacterized protein YbaR (Trm112 family)